MAINHFVLTVCVSILQGEKNYLLRVLRWYSWYVILSVLSCIEYSLLNILTYWHTNTLTNMCWKTVHMKVDQAYDIKLSCDWLIPFLMAMPDFQTAQSRPLALFHRISYSSFISINRSKRTLHFLKSEECKWTRGNFGQN